MLSIKQLANFTMLNDNDSFKIKINSNGYRHLNEDLLRGCDLDLNDGFTDAEYEKPWNNMSATEPLLKFLIASTPNRDLNKAVHGADIVARRGVLAKMAIARQEGKKGDFEIRCECRRGVVFIEDEDALRKYSLKNQSARNRLGTYWGARFEEYAVTSPELNTSVEKFEYPEQKALKNRFSADIRSVVLSELTDLNGNDPIRIFSAGEVDAKNKNNEFVEIKTHQARFDQTFFLKRTSLKWWIQSRLLGVEKIFLGIRDGRGTVNQCRMVELDELKNSYWNGDECLAFLHYTLKGVVRNLKEGESCLVSCRSGILQKSYIKFAGILSRDFKNHFRL